MSVKYLVYALIILIILFVLDALEIVDIPYLEVPNFLSGKGELLERTTEGLKEFD